MNDFPSDSPPVGFIGVDRPVLTPTAAGSFKRMLVAAEARARGEADLHNPVTRGVDPDQEQVVDLRHLDRPHPTCQVSDHPIKERTACHRN